MFGCLVKPFTWRHFDIFRHFKDWLLPKGENGYILIPLKEAASTSTFITQCIYGKTTLLSIGKE